MAIQCATCGTQTRSGAKFCHACGTPIATTSLPSTLPLGATSSASETQAMPPPLATPTAPQARADTEGMNASTSYFPQTPQTYHAPPPLAPAGSSKKSGKTLKIVLISLAIIMALGIASIVGAVYFVSKKVSPALAELKKNGIPSVSTSADSVPDEKLGVPIYPGAKREDTVSTKAGSISGAVVTFSTKDDVEEVATFYREHFKDQPNLQISEISDSNDANNSEGDVVFQVNGEGGTRIITISPDKKRDSRTQIVIIVGKGIPGMSVPQQQPPPKGAMERQAQELQRRAMEQADRALREAERLQEAPPPPPAPKR